MTGSGDTIFALATGGGRTAVAVMRVSGPRAGDALIALAGSPLPPPRRLTLRHLTDPRDGAALDHALVVWMPAPASFTGEDGVELHLHGGPAVRAGTLAALAAMPGLRSAEAGEFTRRAFLAGRLDLTEVEGLADLIEAETEAQRRQALRQLDGGLGRRVEAWRDQLLDALARIEAALDFADEDDVDADVLVADVGRCAESVRADIAALLATSRQGERLREGFTVVVAGPPNAGKSTLLNALAQRDVAIVSDTPGTTRDAIEIHLDLGGLPLRVVDTAGMRETADPVEREGVKRSLRHVAEADLTLWLTAPDVMVSAPPSRSGPVLRVATKSDLGLDVQGAAIAVSAARGDGIEALLDILQARVRDALGSGDALVTRVRQRAALERCMAALQPSHDTISDDEILAEMLRSAVHALGEVIGKVGVEAMLDRLFASFCIGK